MSFWTEFRRLLPRRPLRALGAVYWRATGRSVRARSWLRDGLAELPFTYGDWIAWNEQGADEEARDREETENWPWKPRFQVHLYSVANATLDEVNRSKRSILEQSFPAMELNVADDDRLDTQARYSEADCVVLLRAGDTLSRSALFRFAKALQAQQPDAQIVFGDQDVLDGGGHRRDPWFKPSWNPAMFLAMDYLSPGCAIAMPLVRRVASMKREEAPTLADQVLEATAASAERIVHVPSVICHVAESNRSAQPVRKEALERHLRGTGACVADGKFGTHRVIWPLPSVLPHVTLIIPTKDKIDVLAPCLRSLESTTYPHFDVLIIDNGSAEAESLGFLEAASKRPNINVITYPAPYNFSAINNHAARQAQGSLLCLLNNDTEVIEPDWLTDMVRYAVRPDIGAVGAKLLYPDLTIQHAGVCVGLGGAAGHSHRFDLDNEVGYFGQAHVAQDVMAVTAACLLVAKSKYWEVGGLDEEHLRIAYNDVDFCLKLRMAGYRNIYEPAAVLFHHESKSRGNDLSPQHIDRYMRELQTLQERWKTDTLLDPFHNIHLDRHEEQFVIGRPEKA